VNIYVGNLSSDVSEENLRQAFESLGQVASAKIIKDKYTGQSRGFSFVEMPGQSQAQAAIKRVLDKEKEGDQVVRTEEGRNVLLIGADLMPALEDVVIDYKETPEGTGFTISKHAPNA
jgi:Fe-S cluster assembly iron-binding protein IscA